MVGQVSVPLRANADDAVLIISLLNHAQPTHECVMATLDSRLCGAARVQRNDVNVLRNEEPPSAAHHICARAIRGHVPAWDYSVDAAQHGGLVRCNCPAA